MKGKILSLFIVISMVCSIIPVNCQEVKADTAIKLGDYIQFGSYYQKPILWRVINIDEDGNPLLFSEHVICSKAYDARGSKHGDEDRKAFGSNEWQFSTIRQWLNSSEKNIQWIKNPPSADNVFFKRNPYDKEAGFLADGNFTQTERALIKPVKHKVLLGSQDINKKEGGTEAYIEASDLDKNYDNAYYINIEDGVFLLSLKEMKEYVCNRGWYNMTTATPEALKNSNYKELEWPEYWLRTPVVQFAMYSSSGAHEPYFVQGIRPAFYLNKSMIASKSGVGTEKSPYIIKGDDKKILPGQISKYKVGDYVKFGSYNNEPILWRIINVDKEGSPLLFSEDIISIKAFDTKGDFHKDNDREGLGSNEWENSNIRQWLNSSEQTIKWIQNPPISEGMSIWDGNSGNKIFAPNSYNLEKGFLADGNFNESERALIKQVNHKVLLSQFDSSKKDGGAEAHNRQSEVSISVQNYDNSYYKNIADKVFFLSVKELKEYVYDRGWEYRSKLTVKAIENSYHMFIQNDGSYWGYWLRTPNGECNYDVKIVDNSSLGSSSANNETGIRPALYINSSALAKFGDGTQTNPYIIGEVN